MKKFIVPILIFTGLACVITLYILYPLTPVPRFLKTVEKVIVPQENKQQIIIDSLLIVIYKQQEQLAKFDFIDKQADSTFIAGWARFMIDCGMGDVINHFTNKYSFEEFCKFWKDFEPEYNKQMEQCTKWFMQGIGDVQWANKW